jgi:hypothetical protein
LLVGVGYNIDENSQIGPGVGTSFSYNVEDVSAWFVGDPNLVGDGLLVT